MGQEQVSRKVKMSFLDDVAIISNSYKRYHSRANIGHYVQKMGEWDGSSGYDPGINTLKFGTTYTPCALVFVTTTDFREHEMDITVTYNTCKRQTDSEGAEIYEERTLFDQTLKRPLYEADTQVATTITIPAYERVGTAYRIGSGSTAYEIVSITHTPTSSGITGNVYALASVGAKLIYGLSFQRLMHDLDDISRGIWASPPLCMTCEGTGVINVDEVCPQCNGYKYDGRAAVNYLLDRKADEVGVGSDTNIAKYQDKIWMKKWWVTPTKSEIQRVFAHFANLPSDKEVIIVERYSDPMPIAPAVPAPEAAWQLMLPTAYGVGSHFGNVTVEDRDIFRDLLYSVTPAGTVSYLTWYANAVHTDWSDGWGQELVGSGWKGGYDPTCTHLWGGWGGVWGDVGFPISGWSTSLTGYVMSGLEIANGLLYEGDPGYDTVPYGYGGYWYNPNSGYRFPYGS